ncbi:MAG: hypothetical protein WC175_05620 [Candidatus Dojkabacteria bacterium]
MSEIQTVSYKMSIDRDGKIFSESIEMTSTVNSDLPDTTNAMNTVSRMRSDILSAFMSINRTKKH